MKARYQYRFYPTDQQHQSLAQVFGCVRVVWNDALAICKQAEKLPSNNDLQKLVITQAKQTEERGWLADVSCVPLQQSVADLGVAYKNFFDAFKGKRKGKRVGTPKFKKKTGRQSARFRIGGFSIKGNSVYLAKIGNVSPVWSRELPSSPSSVTVIKDAAHRYFLSFVVEVEPVQIDTKNHSIGIDLGIKTFAAMSNGEMVKSPDYSRLDQRLRRKQKQLVRQVKFIVISRWEPTSQICSDCGYKWGKLDLSIRSVFCINCGTEHDRDENAAKNINKVGIGHCHDSKWARIDRKTTSVAS
jgi:putative transposase